MRLKYTRSCCKHVSENKMLRNKLHEDLVSSRPPDRIMTGLKEVTGNKTLLTSLLCQQHTLVEVILNRNALTWKDTETRKPANGTISELGTAYHVVQTCEIVSVHETQPNADSNKKISKIDLQQHTLYLHAFTVFYVKRAGQHKWRCSDITFHCTNRGLCQQWVQTIDEQLSLLSNRPRSLLVYINPYGGKGLGKQIYERKVAPLFQRASISADVIVTEHANHAKNHLRKEADLEKYDGVVCVGGDGMFSEVLHGLVAWTQTHHGVDQNQMDAELVPCSLRIGIIPAGSTDCVCFATVGTSDPITSALHIIVGDSQPLDVCSVHHNNTFLKYSASLLGYGFYGDVLTDSEGKRWLGPGRYDLAGIKAFLSHNHYEGTISFLPIENSRGNPRDKLLCRAGCRVCQHQSSETAAKTEHSDKASPGLLSSVESIASVSLFCETMGEASGGVWHDISGKFVAINAASMSCACPRSPKGLSPSAHLADGTTDLILVRQCTRLDFLRHLVRHTNEEDQFDHPFIEVHRVRRFSFQPKFQEAISIEDHSETKTKPFGPIFSAGQACDPSTVLSSWTCDGEILPHASIHVSVQPKLIRLFARGIEDKQE